jgi:hypothetical protein
MLLITVTSCTVSNLNEQSGRLPSGAQAGYLNHERIFTSKEFEVKKFGPIRWLEDGSKHILFCPRDLQLKM